MCAVIDRETRGVIAPLGKVTHCRLPARELVFPDNHHVPHPFLVGALELGLELAVADAQLDDALQAIETSAKTGRIGDGKIWVTDVIDVVRIRTGERGDEAV